jgi:hypothetical protein
MKSVYDIGEMQECLDLTLANINHANNIKNPASENAGLPKQNNE